MKARTLCVALGIGAMASIPVSADAAVRCPGNDNNCGAVPAAENTRTAAQFVAPRGKQASPKAPAAPRVAEVNSNPEGQTYGRWASEWWQWALSNPAATNPVTDTTGAHCAQRQAGDVWFLAGSFGSSPVTRSCAIPFGKSLFFPLINTFYGAYLNDEPPSTRTPEFVRSMATCTEAAQISVRIDRFNVPKPTRFFTGPSGSQSPIFYVQMPPDNLFGADPTTIPELVLHPAAEQGYYLFVKPLARGLHTISWTATGCVPGFAQDIIYNLNVQ